MHVVQTMCTSCQPGGRCIVTIVVVCVANETQEHMCNTAPHCQHGAESPGNIASVNTLRVGLQE